MSCLTSHAFAAKPEKSMVVTAPEPALIGENLYDKYPYSLLYYYGKTVNGAFVGTVVGNFKPWPEHIQSLEFAYTLPPENPFRKGFSPIISVIQLAANVTIRNGNNEPTIFEFDPYVVFRWANMPWNHYIVTSLALAEGVSYVSSVPAIEKRNGDNYKRLINYLMFEATFAAPEHPRMQFVFRVHHRSGAFGLYGAGNNGSNEIGAGIRYLF